ncbi:SDR family NAD(P)-dependent oxidoreductase [Pseudomonas typographi]|uniref:SDR family NAD(P)-dependent oxidoreductase n=1 Tax=Pseudomonas typographi TaxID=2715964 RepID=A0ABR7Z2J4_9PSED|nr:SDR family NAD(P)-dependent oxidoreductase [Pseudomonas typographi]MBD1599613.1 SDR family NAD(P)-dependent oxidoreductase [Pseudomonas typographi]
MHIEQQHFVVSGAASGLGLASVQMLVRGGAQVLMLDRDESALAAAAEALGQPFVVADVADASEAQAAIASALARFGSLQGLVNCAGIVRAEKILGRNGPHGLGSFAQVVAVNLIGTFNMLRLAAEAMAAGPADAQGNRGVVINTASVAAFDGQVGQAAYAASKGAVASLTLPAARELAHHGIRVVAIAPGVFETPMLAGMSDEVRAGLCAAVPFPPRLGRPEEYAALVRHIIENDMLNGEVIRLDGALRMSAG